MKKFLMFILLAFMCVTPFCEAASLPKIFKKKPKYFKPYMVQTKEEWLEAARDINLDERVYKRPEVEIKAKLNKIVDPTPYLVKYNMPLGGYEVDLKDIKQEKTIASLGVSSPLFDKMAIVYYYYTPVYNQISSEVFIVPLDTTKSHIGRILDAKVVDTNKGQNLISGTLDFQQDLFSAFTIVDWTPDGRAVLLREKIGTSNSGIFRTNLWVILVDENTQTIKSFPKLQERISKYWRENRGLILNQYRWDIEVLGFSQENPSKAIVLAYANEKEGKKMFLGAWSVDIYADEIKLLSKKDTDFDIAVSGVILKFRKD